MKKIALIIMLIVIAAFAGQTEAGIVNVKETKYGTEMTFWPNKAIEAGHVYSVVMEDYEGFKSIEINNSSMYLRSSSSCLFQKQ